MNTLFIWPEFPVTYWGAQYSLGLIRKGAVMPPLSLITVAALCPQKWTMRLVDLNVEQLQDSDIEWADIVVLSGMAIQDSSMQSVLQRCKKAGVPTLVGGPHATSSPDKLDDATYLLLDEAEITLPLFLDDLEQGQPQRVYTAAGKKPDVTKTPLPRFDLLKISRYVNMCIQFSRGCPFACEFCDITTLYGRTPRTKQAQQLLAEVQAIYDTGFRGEIFLVDDNFIGNKKDVKTMLPHLIQWQKEHGYPFWFYTEASINLADDDELLILMGQANFHSVFIGIETPSMEGLRETHKFQNLQGDLLGKIHRIQEYGIEVMAGFIVGFDSDTEDIFDRQIEFITRARIPRAMIGPLNAMPNTQLWVRLKQEGRLQEEFAGDTFGFCNFETRLPAVTLAHGYKRILATIYSPENYFVRMRALFEHLDMKHNESINRLSLDCRMHWVLRMIPAFIRLSVVDKHRLHYWNFLLWVALKHPAKLMFALGRTLSGYHFIKYTADVMVPRLTLLEKKLSKQDTVLMSK